MENEKYTTKEKNEILKLLKEKWSKLEGILNNRGFSNYGNQLFKQCLQETKEHDNFRSSIISRGISLNDEARLFAVQRLTEHAFNIADYKPELKDFMHVQKSVYMAYALSQEFKNDIKSKVTRAEAKQIKTFDYVKLI